MKALLLKEFKTIFCSSAGAFFSTAFLLITSLLLWVFSGSYNIIDAGYANLDNFFALAPVLFAILIPALTMRQFSEERRSKTLDILLSRPVRISEIYFSKFFASFLFVVTTLLTTVVFVVSIYQLSNPIGNIDVVSIAVSYVSLILIISVFISIGLFASAITKNQIIALIVAVVLCLFSFYGFDLLTSLFLSGKIQAALSSVGLYHHYKLMQRGVIQLKDLLVVFNYLFVFSILSLFVFSRNRKKLGLVSIIVLIIINLLFLFIPNSRFDFTSDKRYTLHDYSKRILNSVGEEQNVLNVHIYLTGNLNAGFQRLQDATAELLADFNRYGNNTFNISYVNVYSDNNMAERMYEQGMPPIALNETDREGKVSQKLIYPYAQITNGTDTLVVSLLKNIAGNTAEENLNASIESLEFEFIDAVRLLQQQAPKSVAFVEGHGELTQVYVYDAEELLSKYYFVNRGQIGNEIGVLDGFDAVIIAGAYDKYSEPEKYIIDQYIMNGGRILWLVDGAYYSKEDLAREGQSPSMKNDVNLDDMLFSYGVRINPDLIQDRQSVSVYLTSDNGVQSSALVPFFYMPLLIPSPNHPITKNIKDVKAPFASSLEVVNNSPDVRKTVLLTTSANAHLVKVPEMINFDVEHIQNTDDYFNQPYIPVALSLEGKFNSAFANRMIPEEVEPTGHKTVDKSSNTKMVVVGSSAVISNEIQGTGVNTQVLPMGYDRVSQTQFGNRDFIVNAVNWLTDDDGWMDLRTRQQQLYVLNKKAAYDNRNKYAILNTVLPTLLMLFLIGAVFAYRKRKYEK